MALCTDFLPPAPAPLLCQHSPLVITPETVQAGPVDFQRKALERFREVKQRLLNTPPLRDNSPERRVSGQTCRLLLRWPALRDTSAGFF